MPSTRRRGSPPARWRATSPAGPRWSRRSPNGSRRGSRPKSPRRDLLTALFELRLEAARRPGTPSVRLWDGTGADPAEIALHHTVDGLLLAHLTSPDPTSDPVIGTLVAALLPTEPPITRPRAVAYVIRDGDVLVFNHRPSASTETAGLQVPGGTVHDGEDPAAAVVREGCPSRWPGTRSTTAGATSLTDSDSPSGPGDKDGRLE